MGNAPLVDTRSAVERVLATPTPASLWELQKALLAMRGGHAERALAVAREFHSCLRTLESKSASRSASRWGAVLGTAAVASVSLRDLLGQQERVLEHLLESALPSALEVGSALELAQAWEVEAQLIYDEFAWFLYSELWDLSAAERPELSVTERRARIDQLLDPLLDSSIPDDDRAWLVVDVFRAVLAARLAPLLEAGAPSG